jgi:hypothetical protein
VPLLFTLVVGHGLVLMYIVIGISASITHKFLLHAENCRRDRGERDEIIEGSHQEEGTQLERNGRYTSAEGAKREKGQKHTRHAYILTKGNLQGTSGVAIVTRSDILGDHVIAYFLIHLHKYLSTSSFNVQQLCGCAFMTVYAYNP